MEFFSTTGFFCLAMVAAVALIALMLWPQPHEPASTYVEACAVERSEWHDGADRVGLRMLPDHTALLERTGEAGDDVTAVNVVAVVTGNKVRITEKSARPMLVGAPVTALRLQARLKFFKKMRGKCYIRYESEITGQWCTFTMLCSDGYEAGAGLRY